MERSYFSSKFNGDLFVCKTPLLFNSMVNVQQYSLIFVFQCTFCSFIVYYRFLVRYFTRAFLCFFMLDQAGKAFHIEFESRCFSKINPALRLVLFVLWPRLLPNRRANGQAKSDWRGQGIGYLRNLLFWVWMLGLVRSRTAGIKHM